MPGRDFDTKDGEEIDHGNRRSAKENVLVTESVPDDAAYQGDGNGKEMVNAHAHAQGGSYVVRTQGNLFQVCGACHTYRYQKLVCDEAGGRDKKGSISLPEECPGETVPNTDKNKNHGLCRQDGFFAQLVYSPSQDRQEYNTYDTADGDEFCQHLRGLFENRYQDPGRKGEENLLACSVQNVKPVEKPVLFEKLQSQFRMLGFVRLHESQDDGGAYETAGRYQEGLCEIEVQVAKADEYNKTSKDCRKVSYPAQLAQSSAVRAFFGKLHAYAGIQRQEYVLSQTVDEKAGEHKIEPGREEADENKSQA